MSLALPSEAKLDRDYYLGLAKSQGLAIAISALHQEMAAIENESFEGREGYRPELYAKLAEYRNFSRQLWEMR